MFYQSSSISASLYILFWTLEGLLEAARVQHKNGMPLVLSDTTSSQQISAICSTTAPQLLLTNSVHVGP